MIITPKIDYLEGYFDTKKVRMNCVTSKNRGRIDLCLESDDGINIPIARVKLFSNDLFVDFIETFDDASKFAEEIAPEPIYIRFVYDDTFNNHINDYNFTDLFIKQILPIFGHDDNVIWQLIKKSSWKRIDSDNRPQPTIVDCFKNYRGYKWIPFPQRYISKHKEHYQEIIDNTKVGNDTIFLCDRVDLFKIK